MTRRLFCDMCGGEIIQENLYYIVDIDSWKHKTDDRGDRFSIDLCEHCFREHISEQLQRTRQEYLEYINE